MSSTVTTQQTDLTMIEAEILAAEWRAEGFRVGVNSQTDNGKWTPFFVVRKYGKGKAVK